MILQHLEDQAKKAHYWTSFSAERRGEQMIKDYSEELTADLSELKSQNVDDENLNDYKVRYERLFSSYLHAKGNTFSAMITGPANFNTRRHAKANRSEEKHYELFREWRERAKKAIIRKMQPAKTFVSELERYRQELAGMKRNHELMKDGNKRIKEANKSNEDLTDYLINTFGIAPHMIEWTMKFGFGLQNNNANMKRVEQRIKELEAKEQKRNEEPQKSYKFVGGEVVMNYEADRIQIFFTQRPTAQELTEWKNNGLNSFNWSPSVNAWQRKITPNAIWTTKRMFKDKFSK
jgi:hypothetical protein